MLKKNIYAKELLTKKYKPKIVNPKREKAVSVEKILKSSSYLLYHP